MAVQRLARLGWATLGATILLILAGGLVHATGSALACPDWPLCYGSATPTMQGGVFYEHGHRLIAATVALLALLLTLGLVRASGHKAAWAGFVALLAQGAFAGWIGARASEARLGGTADVPQAGLVALAFAVMIAMACVLWLLRARQIMPALGLALVQLVEFQSLLGGLTVLLRLPTAVSTAHLATAMLFAAAVVVLLFALARNGAFPRIERTGVALAAGLVYVQLLLGALVRHTGSALACNTDVLACNGAALPSTGAGWLLWSHRLLAIVVTAAVVAALWQYRSVAPGGRLRHLPIALAAGVTAQVGLGVATVLSYVAVSVATAHLVLGALLWVGLVALSLAPRGVSSFSMRPIVDAIVLAKPRLTSLVLVTAGTALWLAPGSLSSARACVIMLGIMLVVAGANALNSYIERDTDALMHRTMHRPLPAHRLAPNVAMAIGVGYGAVGTALLLATTNLLTATLGLAALLVYVLAYTPLKRVSTLALVVGAFPGATPPLMGWTAMTGRLDLEGLVLFAILFVWQLPHFLAVSYYLRDDYARGGHKVFSVVHGDVVTKLAISLTVVLLIPISYLPRAIGMTHFIYPISAALLGLVLLSWTLRGLNRRAGSRWARDVFVASIVYLVALLGALLVGAKGTQL